MRTTGNGGIPKWIHEGDLHPRQPLPMGDDPQYFVSYFDPTDRTL